MFLFPDREPKFPDGALFIPIKSDRISLVKRKACSSVMEVNVSKQRVPER